MKRYKVSMVTPPAKFDSLPVLKVTHYPLEKRDYKPYSQGICCVSKDEIFLRSLAFELTPMAESSLKWVFYPSLTDENKDLALTIEAFNNKRVELGLYQDGKTQLLLAADESGKISSTDFGGEDLQGVYWGATITLSKKYIAELFGGEVFLLGDIFAANFYKLCSQSPNEHYGSSFAADFNNNPFSRDCMGEFEVVSY